jgi:transglutaminase-like putative cysteine protease
MVADGTDSFKASYCAKKGEGYCLPKASLMIALCRKGGIPARLGLADVRNHLSTPKLDALLQSDIFSMHGYVEVLLNERWVKATPAFNNSLCEKYGIRPLEFDGQKDSIFHAYTKKGNKHMEYLEDYGTFADMPVDFIFQKFQYHYPHLMDNISQADQQGHQSLESEMAIK